MLFSCGLLLSVGALAGEYSGLWVGTATLNHVSEINARGSDLSFDLGLVGIKSHERLIQTGDSWWYEDSGSDLGDGWRGTDFDHSNWPSGAAGLGFGGEEATAVSKHPTVYFRRTFDIVIPESDKIDEHFAQLRLRVWRDDGIIIYLNGEEVLRNNLKTSYVDFNSYAVSEIVDINVLEISLPTTRLVKGGNTLAVEVHAAADGDEDLFFDLELTGGLVEPVLTQLIDTESGGWKYHYSEQGPGSESGWQSKDYNDSTWQEGRGPFGYGDNDQKTPLPHDSSRKPPAAYFRKALDMPVDDFTALRFLLLRDDGAVVYLNGTEAYRTNMPTGDIGHDTPPVKAIGAVDENRYVVHDTTDLTMDPGSYVVAVEVHQHPGELGAGTSDVPVLTRTPATFNLRFMLHVDSGNAVRLLKEVIQMYDAANAKYVLLTDHTLVPDYQGVAIRDNEPTGRRISAIGFGFDGQQVACDGDITPTGTVTCNFTLTSDHPANPFLHSYHPDHDNLDDRYEQTVVEAYEIDRSIQIWLSSRYPPDTDYPERTSPIGWGTTLLGGTYRETLSGLHKEDIVVNGPFILERASDVDRLTP